MVIKFFWNISILKSQSNLLAINNKRVKFFKVNEKSS